MIYITGDTHGCLPDGFMSVDGFSRRLNSDSFPEQKAMTKEDYIIIAGDFAAYAVPWYGALVAVGRLIAALLWMILLPLLGLLLKVRFFRLGAGIAIFMAGLLYNIFVFQGFSFGGSIVGMVVWGVTILYLLGAVIYPLKESKE
jgi:hypothetical protein